MRAIITVIGKDTTGIIAQVSDVLWQKGVNIVDITQSVLDDLFVMVMLTDISKSSVSLSELSGQITGLGEKLGLKIHMMHEDVFNSMHRI